MEISWRVYEMDRHASYEDKEDVIYFLHWECIASQDGHGHRITGCSPLDMTDLSGFIDYANVTEEQVMTWLTDTVDVESLEDKCRDGLEKKLNPVTLNGLPWGGADGEEE